VNAWLQAPVAGFAIRWVLCSTVGLGMGLALGLSLSRSIEAFVGMMLVTPVILALAGSVFGASQWLAVWKWQRAAIAWIAASAVALGAGMTLGIVIVETAGRAITGEQVRLFGIDPVGRIVGLAVIGSFTGLTVGAAQRLALRLYGAALGFWVARCTAAFGLGLPGAALVADVWLGGLQRPAGFVTFLGLAGLIVGLLTLRGAERVPAELAVRRAV